MQDSILLIGVGLGAVVIHCMFKVNSLLRDAQAGNVSFSWKKDYLYKDYLSIIISFSLVFLWYFLYTEFASNYPQLDGWKVTSFVGVAWFGSYIVQQVMGRGKKLIRKAIDEKTNQLNSLLGKEGEKTTL